MKLRHGIFLAPFHQVHENPTLCIERDLELVELLDRLDFQEAWIGEHHSTGVELFSSPELFIAAAAERTKHIRFGTGVISIPYHNPLMVADRIIQLDHMTRGRVMCGIGPGVLTKDALMLGIDPNTQRDRMREGLDVLIRFFRGETVTETTDWYRFEEAHTQLRPYTDPYPEVAVASTVTPSGGRLAGRYDLGMLCLAADDRDGFNALDVNWRIACDAAAEHGRTMDPSRLRIVAPMHIADTREEAIRNVRFGLPAFMDYFNIQYPRYHIPSGVDPVDWYVEQGFAVIGTPDDAIARIETLQKKQGEFGALLLHGNNWADWEQTKRSYELYARYVMPHFAGSNTARQSSYDWVSAHTGQLGDLRKQAIDRTIAQHEAERGQRDSQGA